MGLDTQGLFERLQRIANPVGPSGFERLALDAWQADAEGIGGGSTVTRHPAGGVEVRTPNEAEDEQLNAGGKPEPRWPARLITGHIDEIGVVVTGADSTGCLFFKPIGGWDPTVLSGQRITLMTRVGPIRGVIVRKGVHLMDLEERKTLKMENLFIDIGALTQEEAEERVRPGDHGVIDASLERLGDELVLGRALDNRIGAFAVLEAARRVSRPLDVPLVALATTGEEIGWQSSGAGIAGSTRRFAEAVVVDMGFESGHPDFPARKAGERKFGTGVTFHRGGALSEDMFEKMEAIAEARGIPRTIRAINGYSGTDSDGISRSGCPTTLVSIPIRYMHTPCEIARLEDIEALVSLLVGFAESPR